MLKTLGKEVVLYGIGQIVTQSLSIFILPLITHSLSVDEVGLLELLGMLESVSVIACLLCLDSAINYHFWDSKGDENAQRNKVTSGLLGVCLCTAVTDVVLMVISGPLISAYKLESQSYVYYLCVASISLQGVFSYLSRLCRVHQRPILFNSLVLLDLVLYLVGFAIFAYGVKMGIASIYLSRVIAHTVSITIGLTILRKQIKGKFKWGLLWDQLKYGLPLVPNMLIAWSMQFTDRFFVNQNFGTREVGIYGVASKVSMASALIISSFRMAWGPYSMSIKNSPKAPAVYARVAKYFLVVTLAFVLLLQAVCPLLILILSTREYLSASDIVSVLSLGVCLSGMYNIVNVGPSVSRKTYLISIGTFVGAVVNVGLNALLVPSFSNMGAATATSVGYGVSVLFLFMLGQKSYPIPYEYRLLLITAIDFIVSYAAAMLIGQWFSTRLILRALVGTIPVVFFLGVIHFTGVMDLRIAVRKVLQALPGLKRKAGKAVPTDQEAGGGS